MHKKPCKKRGGEAGERARAFGLCAMIFVLECKRKPLRVGRGLDINDRSISWRLLVPRTAFRYQFYQGNMRHQRPQY